VERGPWIYLEVNRSSPAPRDRTALCTAPHGGLAAEGTRHYAYYGYTYAYDAYAYYAQA